MKPKPVGPMPGPIEQLFATVCTGLFYVEVMYEPGADPDSLWFVTGVTESGKRIRPDGKPTIAEAIDALYDMDWDDE